jgi:hypothetical protein
MMTAVIGLGNAGCKIADLLSQYPQYSCYKFDVGLKRVSTAFLLKSMKS